MTDEQDKDKWRIVPVETTVTRTFPSSCTTTTSPTLKRAARRRLFFAFLADVEGSFRALLNAADISPSSDILAHFNWFLDEQLDRSPVDVSRLIERH